VTTFLIFDRSLAIMGNPHHLAHWYPTAAYLYILGLDALALAWEYLRRHPDYRLDWLRRARRPDAAQRWGLRLLEDPALDAREAYPAWVPGHDAVVQLYPDADPPQDATTFAFWRIPGHKQLLHDGKGLALTARSPGHCLRFALAPGLEDGMAVAYARRGGTAAPVRSHAPGATFAATTPRPTPSALLELHTLQARPCAMWAKDCSVPTLWPTGTATAACARRCAAWCGAAMR
jgi:hypothetical protein